MSGRSLRSQCSSGPLRVDVPLSFADVFSRALCRGSVDPNTQTVGPGQENLGLREVGPLISPQSSKSRKHLQLGLSKSVMSRVVM